MHTKHDNRLKIQPEHLKQLKDLLSQYDTPANREPYITKELSDMRYRWDLLYAGGDGFVNTLYQYLNDSHIDAALKSFIKTLKR